MQIDKPLAEQELNRQFVVFSLQAEKYGVEISFVKEIIRWSETTQLPQMPSAVRGVIRLRNQVIPVISLHRQFGLAEPESSVRTKIIILEMGTVVLGINVDDVDEVVHIKESTIENPKGLAAKADVIQGIAKMDDYLLILIDIKSLFSTDVIEHLAEQNEQEVG